MAKTPKPPPEEKPTLLELLLKLSGIQKAALGKEARLSRSTVHRLCSGDVVNEPHAGTWLLLSSTLSRMLGRDLSPEDVQKLAETKATDPLRAGEEIDAALRRKPKRR